MYTEIDEGIPNKCKCLWVLLGLSLGAVCGFAVMYARVDMTCKHKYEDLQHIHTNCIFYNCTQSLPCQCLVENIGVYRNTQTCSNLTNVTRCYSIEKHVYLDVQHRNCNYYIYFLIFSVSCLIICASIAHSQHHARNFATVARNIV